MKWIFAFLCMRIASAFFLCRKVVTLTNQNPSYHFESKDPYLTPMSCEWKIIAPNGPLSVSCPEFDVLKATNCRDVFLAIFDGTWKAYCGSDPISEEITGRSVIVRFVSRIWRNTSKRGYGCSVSYNPKTATTAVTDTSSETSVPKCACGQRRSAKIVGGEETGENEFPWQAMLLSSNVHFCGGALVHRQWVVTAAHCTDSFRSRDIIVRLGEHNKKAVSMFEKEFNVKRIIQHASYSRVSYDNDIALLELSQSIPDDAIRISAVCLPFGLQTLSLSGKYGTATGWGIIQEGNRDTSNLLRKVDLPFKTTEECQLYLGRVVTNNMICTYQPGKDSCQGDSGGPLVYENEDRQNILMGIVSWGYGCAQVSRPGVYTKVTNYLDWIKTQTGKSNELCGV